ncbi:MAG TPA: DUF2846 domain-containing protein [Candidatus Acidoferrales bacterium]|nr:DUF2846 domain-containing protein [Candidatus Acidoferrales bacterium]
MRLLLGICAAILILQGPADLARAQQPAATPSQNPGAPAAEEKQRTARETKKQLEQLACGPSHVHLVHHTEEGPQTLPEAPTGKGLIYVIRTKSVVGSARQANLAMDGKWVGVNRLGNYFYIEADPGPHYFCMKLGAFAPGLLSLVIEQGKTYYLRQNVTLGGGIEIDLLDEKEGKQYVANYHRSSFEEKHDK